MLSFILRRLFISVPVFFLTTMLVFGLYAASPGDPIVSIVGYDTWMKMAPEQKVKLNKQYGFDQPIPVRYVRWLYKAVQGDLGYPYRGSKSVVMHLSERITPTLVLMGTSLVVSMMIGIPMGIYMALKPYTWGDYLITTFSFAQLAFPSFFVGLGMIYLFSLKLDIFPPFGMQRIGSPFSVIDRLQHIFMPAMVLGAFNAGIWARYARSGMLAEMRSPYIMVARAKGLKSSAVIIRHAFRNALLPLITIIALDLPHLLGGAVITEQIFQWPGMGMLTIRATNVRDYPMLMGVLLISAVMVLMSSLVADVLYAVADPRVRVE